MRVLGVDFGGTRIGIAAVDTDVKLPTPLGVLEASGTLAKDAVAIRDRAKLEAAERVVVGLPLNSGEETKMSRICRLLGDRLTELGVEVHYVDESLTSATVEGHMRDGGLKGSQIRKNVDALAACAILDRYLSEHGEER